jgi:SAM-dependent methyltransferase
MTTAVRESFFICPECRQPLTVARECLCGFSLRESNGILHLMTEEDMADMRPFLQAFEEVRRAEAWGGDDLDLPFRAKRHRDIWDIRQRTFRVFQSIADSIGRGLAVDVGAGNCWMTRYLTQWGFEAIAIDINDDPVDGLQAGRKFIDEGARFLRIRTRMEKLPFHSCSIQLLALNASFHYTHDFKAALCEFDRVLAPGGMIAIIDTPFYENNGDGERMLAERVKSFRDKYGMPETLARSSRYLTFRELEELAASFRLKCHVRKVWPGFKRKCEEVRSGFLGQRIAQFPVVLLERE